MAALLISIGVLLIAGALFGRLAHMTERSTMIAIMIIGALLALSSFFFLGR